MTPEQESRPLLSNEDRPSQTSDVAIADDEDVPFPWKQLIVLAICRLAEPIAFVSITAYSFEMVKAIKGEDNASFYSGLLVSAFALAEACTAMFWGQLSDRYGRKPIILIALAGTGLSSLLFGFAKNYWLALLARVVGGLLNGNVAVMQTMVAEMVSRPEHEPKAYAMQPFVWSVGSVMASALGGFTAEPAVSYPRYFSKDGIFGRFPYLLPNLVAVAVIIIAMIQGYFLMEETNAAVVDRSKQADMTQQDDSGDGVTPLSRQATNTSRGSGSKVRRASDGSYIAATAPIPNDPSFDLRRPSLGSIGSFIVTSKQTPRSDVQPIQEAAPHDAAVDSPSTKAFTKDVNLWIVALIIMCYHQMAYAAILPIYILDEPRQQQGRLDLRGGLGQTLPDVGTYLSTNSLISMFIQGFVFPVFVGKLGVWRAVIVTTILCPIAYIMAPFTTLLPNPRIGIYAVMVIQNFCTIIIYPSLLILLKNATPSLQVLGKVNGLAMSGCSGARTVSPPVVGAIYSATGSAGAWWSNAIVAIIAAIEFIFLNRPKETNMAVLRKASVSAG